MGEGEVSCIVKKYLSFIEAVQRKFVQFYLCWTKYLSLNYVSKVLKISIKAELLHA